MASCEANDPGRATSRPERPSRRPCTASLRTLRPKAEIAARLAAVIGPAEELYWRGLLQSELTRRYGPVKGAAAATAAYSGVHLCTRNPTLIGAATVAG